MPGYLPPHLKDVYGNERSYYKCTNLPRNFQDIASSIRGTSTSFCIWLYSDKNCNSRKGTTPVRFKGRENPAPSGAGITVNTFGRFKDMARSYSPCAVDEL